MKLSDKELSSQNEIHECYMKWILVIQTIIIFLVSCSDYDQVSFLAPQPASSEPLLKFNKKICGVFKDCNDADNRLYISTKYIIQKEIDKKTLHRNHMEIDSLEEGLEITDNYLNDFYSKKGYLVYIIDDSIFLNHETCDTIFQFSERQVLKHYKQQYYMSTLKDDKSWSVYRLYVNQDTLWFGAISPTDTLLNFDFVEKEVSFEEEDSSSTTNYKLSPKSKKEFNNLLKTNSFNDFGCFCRDKSIQ